MVKVKPYIISGNFRCVVHVASFKQAHGAASMLQNHLQQTMAVEGTDASIVDEETGDEELC